MQNLICSKRYTAVSQNLIGSFLRYDLNKYGICNAIFANISSSSKINRLCFPSSHRYYRKLNKGLIGIQSQLLENGAYRFYCFPKLCNARSFSTTSSTRQKSSNDSSKDSDKKEEDSDKKEEVSDDLNMVVAKTALYSLLLGALYVILALNSDTVYEISWSDFLSEVLLKGQVKEIVIRGQHISVGLKPGATYKGKKLDWGIHLLGAPDVRTVEEKIRSLERDMGISVEDGIPIRYMSLGNDAALAELALLLVFLLIAMKFRNPIKNKFSSLMGFPMKFTLVNPFSGKGVHFKDVAGLKEAKIEVMEFVDYLKNPERYNKLGAKVPKGALLLGPPGCGKTLLAKAVATESSVPFLSMNGCEFVELVGGIGSSRVRSLFAEARKRAPSIIYIDEIDAIGKKRNESINVSGDNESDRTLNQLLVEMDGMSSTQNIIILASTNRADVLDKALLRPGRFDRHILIDLPTLDERIEIFEYHLQLLSMDGKPIQYAKFLAHLTPGFSGAEIANVCNEAALHAATEKKTKVEKSDLMHAVDKVLGGTVKKSSTLTPSEKKVVVYHEAGHAVAAWLLEHVNPLIKITVVPRTNKRLGFSQYADLNQKLQSYEHLFERMCVMLGGRIAENIMFNKISTRAQDDLKRVTEIAYYQVQQFGMSPSVGLISFHKELTAMKTKKPYSKKLANLMDAEVRRIITEAYKRTEKLLQNNKDKLVTLAEALMQKESLTYKDIEALIGPPPFGKKDIIDLEEYNPGVE